MARVYLDQHACATMSETVERSIIEALKSHNPSSIHAEGRRARAIVEEARDRIAKALSVGPSEVVLTSGGTESCNLAVHALASSVEARGGPRRVLTTAYEHPAVSAALAALGKQGFTVEVLRGFPTRDAVEAGLREPVGFVVMQAANHETGCVLPTSDVASLLALRGVPLFIDAAQGVGRIELPFGLAWIAVGASKMGGPTGVGALLAPRGVDVEPLVRGGGQERGRRGGTPPVALIAGFGKAATELSERRARYEGLGPLRDRLENAMASHGGLLNGLGTQRLTSVTNMSFPKWRGSTLVAALDIEGIACSSGAACSSGVDAPSPVLLAMYPDAPERASSAIRISLGPDITESDIDLAVAALSKVLCRRPA